MVYDQIHPTRTELAANGLTLFLLIMFFPRSFFLPSFHAAGDQVGTRLQRLNQITQLLCG